MIIDALQDYSLKLDLIGGGSGTIAAGQTANIDYTVDVLKLMTGAEYFCEGNWEDTISFQIVSDDAVTHQFATDMHISKNGFYQFYKAKLNPGLKVRIVYKNNGSQSAKFKFNLVCHQDK